MTSIIFFIFFLLSSIHLYACYTKKLKLRYITKATLMPSLLLLIFLIAPSNNEFIYLGIFFGFLGDVFLISKKPVAFVLGLASFLIGHLFYIIDLWINIDFFNIKLLYFIPLIFILLYSIFIYKILKDSVGRLKIPTICYILTISSMLSLAFLYFLTNTSFESFITLLGAMLFTLSDSLLSISIFKNKFKNHSFYIMLTYILAQFFISISLI